MNKKIFTEEERENIVKKFRDMNKEHFQYLTTPVLNQIIFNGQFHYSYETANALADLIGRKDCFCYSYPLDKDGIPIKMGDLVYDTSDGGDFNLHEVVGMSFYEGEPTLVYLKDEGQVPTCYIAHELKPRTIEEIYTDLYNVIYENYEKFPSEDKQKLIRLLDEIHKMGNEE